MTAMRIGGRWVGAATLLLCAGAWTAAAWWLWDSTIPSGLHLPQLSESELFSQHHLDRAESYERFHRINWILSTVVLVAVLGWYAARGARFMRESAAGWIGTGMLLAMLGFGIVWLVEVPFTVAANWWDRRHGVSELGYFELLFGGWLGLGASFLFLSFSVLIVMGLARLLGNGWWIVGGPVFVVLAGLFLFVFPYTVTDAHGIRDERLAADVRRLAAVQDVENVDVQVEDVDRYTSAANAYATGLGPSRSVFLWNTLLDGRFSDREVRVVVAHEFGHQARGHLWKAIAWYALFALPGAWLIALATRRRGGMARPEAVPLALLVLVGLTLAASPFQNIISRHMEAEADWEALQATRDPDAAVGLFKEFSVTSLGDPTPPGWVHALLASHPSLLDRIEMARAWKALHPNTQPLFEMGR